MNKALLLAAALFFTLFTNAQTASVSGNVITNYITSKSSFTRQEIGAGVYLFDLNKKYSFDYYKDVNIIKKTRTDINGNYTFNDLPAGTYLLCISSRGALGNWYKTYHDITDSFSVPIKTVSGYDFSTDQSSLQQEIKSLHQQAEEATAAHDNKKYKKAMDQMNKKIDKYFGNVPYLVKELFDLNGGAEVPKDFRIIEIKAGQNEKTETLFVGMLD